MMKAALLVAAILFHAAHSFAPPSTAVPSVRNERNCLPFQSSSKVTTFPISQQQQQRSSRSTTSLSMSILDNEQKFGGYTTKQRLREEVESPFRTVRLYFFGFSTVSALVALYFSLLTTVKAYAGFADAPPMNDALQSVGINVAAVAICGYLSWRDVQAGEANLKRIAKGGALAKLVVTSPGTTSTDNNSSKQRLTPLAEYRRKQRILICAGGKDYVQQVCRSLNADQLADENTIPQALYNSEVIVVPVLLEGEDGTQVGDSLTCWQETMPTTSNDGSSHEMKDRNFDLSRSQNVVAFPRGNKQWADYLESEVETAKSQGFDVLNKGFIIVVKKNGKILRRATGLPPWSSLVNTMEVMDGSKFGMPGDDEKYGS